MIVLASKSPRRKALISEYLTSDFLTYNCDIDEDLSLHLVDPILIVRDIAKRKGEFAYKNFNKEDIIISADTIVYIDKTILGKPKDEDDAYRILKLLSNKTHYVATAYSIIHNNKCILKHVISEVTFNELSDELIRQYISSKSPLDKAGAYGIQDNEKYHIIKEYKGSYYNIVGLPIEELLESLKEIK